MDSRGTATRAIDVAVMSPELALVDPQLARAARALLPDVPSTRPAHTAPSASETCLARAGWMPDELERTRRGASRRVLIGVAAATMLALLLIDVRVEVGERPAVAGPSVPPVSPPSQTPPRATREVPTPRRTRPTARSFAWAPTPNASGYRVEFFRGPTRVYAKDTASPELTVPANWTYEGVAQSLRPGLYRWYVWPVIAGRRESRAVVQTTVSIPPN